MATVTVKDLISASLRLINVLGVGDVLDADTASNALYALNDMVDGWNIEPLMIYTISQATFNLVGGKRDYAMGPTAVAPDFPTTRPVKIQAAGILISGMEYAMDIIGDDEWERIGMKSLGSSIPKALYNRGDWPNTTLSVWPVPSSPYQIIIYSYQNIQGFTDLNATVSLPPGYSEALRYNLAVRLAVELQRPLDPAMAEMANGMKAKVKRSNVTSPLLSCDPAILGGPRWGNLSDFLGGR
jgi:hypothetical protein